MTEIVKWSLCFEMIKWLSRNSIQVNKKSSFLLMFRCSWVASKRSVLCESAGMMVSRTHLWLRRHRQSLGAGVVDNEKQSPMWVRGGQSEKTVLIRSLHEWFPVIIIFKLNSGSCWKNLLFRGLVREVLTYKSNKYSPVNFREVGRSLLKFYESSWFFLATPRTNYPPLTKD